MSFSYYGELCTEVYDLTKEIGQSFNGDIEYYQERNIAMDGFLKQWSVLDVSSFHFLNLGFLSME
ncbi:hypothetical protein ASG81_03855 [Paenibacillus sp. Soil522]|nr:hypothetical protein ASG81_03855 [Paenibacillus sp. Soil522]